MKSTRAHAAIGIAAIAFAVAAAGAAAASFSGASVPGQTDSAAKGNKTVMIKVSCPRSAFRSCSGRLSLKTAQKVAGKFQWLGSAKFSIGSGKTSKVKLNLNGEGQKLIKRGKLSPLAIAASRDGHNRKATRSRKITLQSHGYQNPPPFGGY